MVSIVFERPRRQFVNGSTSERHILQFGVPQVSILGPFFIFIVNLSTKSPVRTNEVSTFVQMTTFEPPSLNYLVLRKYRLETVLEKLTTTCF